MKIYIKGNKQQSSVLYLQLKDIKLLSELEKDLPEEINSFVKDAIASKNKGEFVKLASGEAINYLKNKDWIIDYKSFIRKEPCCIEFAMDSARHRYNTICSLISALSTSEYEQKQYLINEKARQENKISDIKQAIHSVAYNTVLIPTISDPNSSEIVPQPYTEFLVKRCINPNEYIIRNAKSNNITISEIGIPVLTDIMKKIIDNYDFDVEFFESEDKDQIIAKSQRKFKEIQRKQKRKRK